MGVATTIFLSLYASSLTMAKSSRSQKIAAAIAEEHINEILIVPGHYAWPDYESQDPGSRFPLSLKGADNLNVKTAKAPTAMPTNERAHRRERNFYRGFTWEALTRLPSETANHVEVIVVVRWQLTGRDQAFSLTTCIPRTMIGKR